MSDPAIYRHFLVHRANRLPSAHRLAQHAAELRQLNSNTHVQGLWIVHQHSSLLVLESVGVLDQRYFERLSTETALDTALHVKTVCSQSLALAHSLACLELSNYRIDTSMSHIHAIAQQDSRRAHYMIQRFLKTCLQINPTRAAA